MRGFLYWEVLLSLAIAGLALYELIAVWVARQKGLTKNVSRVISHVAILIFILGYLLYSLLWARAAENPDALKVADAMLANWPFLITSVMAGILSVWELHGIYQARRMGLTKNISRLLTHAAMLLLFVGLVFISLKKWPLYLKRLEAPYSNQSPQTPNPK